jgi:xanthine dehydrogenase accessory factor
VVVASQGHYDEETLEGALGGSAGYVGLVASRKRGGGILDDLRRRGVPRVDTVHCPAGLDLGGRTAPDVALSILAEIVKQQPAQLGQATAAAVHTSAPATADVPAAAARAALPLAAAAIDPVCGMSVTIATARHTADHDGITYYFCCPSCRSRFVQTPTSYLSPRA